MATVYEEIEALKTRMTAVENNVTELGSDVSDLTIDVQLMKPAQLEEGDNLNDLDEGVYYIPTAAIAATLLNSPVTGVTGIVEVFTAGANGQIMQRFTPCLKTAVTIYEREFYSNGWGAWSATDLSDSGWQTLPLAEGIEAYGGSVPQYRKVGKVVSLRGAVKNVLAAGTIATLPAGFRPSLSVSYVQNTSMRTGSIAMFTRMIVGANGVIKVEAISDGAAYAADKWFPIHCTFLID